MDNEKLLAALAGDLSTGGHWIADAMHSWTDDEITAFHGILAHWGYQLSCDLTRRVINLSDLDG